MFTSVSVHKKMPHASREPYENELNEIKDKLNAGCLFDRKKLEEPLLSKANDFSLESDICHTVARRMAEHFSVFNYDQVPGYLISKYKNPPPPPSVRPGHSLLMQVNTIPNNYKDNNGNLVIVLLHHSVILDSAGNYFECLPNKYSIDDFDFLPHSSGILGYHLKAVQ